jgi:hypothetical protein
VAEAPPAGRALRLALPPGRYLVRRVDAGHVVAKEITIRPGETATIAEAQLEAIGNERLATKGDEPPRAPVDEASTPPKKWGFFQVAVGASTGPTRTWGSSLYDPGSRSEKPLERSFAGHMTITYGITDRLVWSGPVPAFAYRFGEEGSFEIIPRGGLTSIGYSSLEGVIGSLDAGVALRAWTAPHQSVIASFSADWTFAARTSSDQIRSSRGRTLDVYASLGYALTLHDAVSLHFGAGIYAQPRVRDVEPPTAVPVPVPSAAITFGSVQALGWRSLPLVQVHVSRRFSIDAHASWSVDLRGGGVRDRYLGGFTYAF